MAQIGGLKSPPSIGLKAPAIVALLMQLPWGKIPLVVNENFMYCINSRVSLGGNRHGCGKRETGKRGWRVIKTRFTRGDVCLHEQGEGWLMALVQCRECGGRVSVVRDKNADGPALFHHIQTGTMIYSGNFGKPLVSEYGKYIGISIEIMACQQQG